MSHGNQGPPAGGFGAPHGQQWQAPPQGPPLWQGDPEEGPRRCACGAPAPCVAVAPARFGLLRIGKRRDHRCPRCGKQFRVRTVGHVVFTLCHATFVTMLGGALFIVALLYEREQAPIGGGLLVGGLALLAWAISKLVARVKHPPV